MNTILKKNCNLKVIAFWLFFYCTSLSIYSSAYASLYAVLLDDALPLYKRVITGITIESQVDFTEFSLEGDTAKANDIMKQIVALSPQIIIAIGPKSANTAKKYAAKIPVIYCLVPKLEDYELELPNVFGIRLEFSYEKQLQALQTLFPKVKKIGVLYNPTQSKSTVEQATIAAQKIGIHLVGIEISLPSEAKKALDELKNPIDALWMISDPTALHLKAWDASQQFCIAHKLPFFALDDGFVARGALISFAVDYVWVGRQAARLANRIVFENFSPKNPKIMEPEGLDMAINITTATQLGIAPELSVNLLNYAAYHQHAIQALR